MENPTIWLGNICRKNGLPVTDGQMQLMSRYVELLLEWNKNVNLISRKDINNIWRNHILQSIALLFRFRLSVPAALLDIGTGGGLPGIPLGILCPDLQITLIDSTQKKVNAVKEMILSLGLEGIKAEWGRAEELGKSRKFKAAFDYAVARAVAPLKDLVRWSAPLLKQEAVTDSHLDKSGRAIINSPALLALKGGDVEKEIHQAESIEMAKTIKVEHLVFKGSEQLLDSDKKIIVVHF